MIDTSKLFDLSVYSFGKHSIPIYRDEEIKILFSRNVTTTNGVLFSEEKSSTFLSGTYLFLSHHLDFNYSHFTIKCIQGFLLARREGLLSDKIKIVISQDTKYKLELISLFGIDKHQLISLPRDVTYTVENCYYISNYDHAAFDRKLLNQFSNVFPTVRRDLDIFISRLGNPVRKALNENLVIDFLRKIRKSILIISFDDLPISKQIEYIRRSRFICALHGASGANLVYASNIPFTFVEVFSSNRVDFHHVNLLVSKNCSYSGTVNSVFPKNDKRQNAPYVVDLGLLERAILEPNHMFKV